MHRVHALWRVAASIVIIIIQMPIKYWSMFHIMEAAHIRLTHYSITGMQAALVESMTVLLVDWLTCPAVFPTCNHPSLSALPMRIGAQFDGFSMSGRTGIMRGIAEKMAQIAHQGASTIVDGTDMTIIMQYLIYGARAAKQ